MTFLDQIETYEFLSEDTRVLLREGYSQGRISPQEEVEILGACESTKKNILAEEVKLLSTLQEEQKVLLFETKNIERQIHQAEERFDTSAEASDLQDLEAQI